MTGLVEVMTQQLKRWVDNDFLFERTLGIHTSVEASAGSKWTDKVDDIGRLEFEPFLTDTSTVCYSDTGLYTCNMHLHPEYGTFCSGRTKPF